MTKILKLFKYILFFSILIDILIIIYRKSDKKGFHIGWSALKIATLVSAILAGLIYMNTKTTEPNSTLIFSRSTSIE